MGAIQRWTILMTLGLFFFMVIVDGTIVSIAIPTIAQTVHVATAQATLLVSLYLVVISALLLFFGQLGDAVGRFRLFFWGTVVFVISSLIAGISSDFSIVMAARFFQAVGAAITMATSFALVTEIFPSDQLGFALGIESIFISLGALAGPGLGGIILASFSWHVIFLVNVPVGVLCILVELVVLPKSGTRIASIHLDWLGLAWMMALAMTAYLLSAQVGASPLVILGLLGLLLGLLAGFWHHERRTKYPLMVPEIWQNLVFRRNVTATFINFLVAYSFTLLAPLYLQLGLGYTSQTTGLLLMIPPLVALVVNPLAGILVDRVNQTSVAAVGAGLLLAAEVGLVWDQQQNEPFTFAAISVVMAIGTGLFSTANNTMIMQSVSRDQRGSAGAVNSLTREFGMMMGATGSTILYYAVISHQLGQRTVTAIDVPNTARLAAQSIVYLVGAGLLISIWWLMMSLRRHINDRKESRN